ncbi:MAG: hypothetical protein ACHP6H_07245 [Legionellales bacterium]
MLFTLAMVVFFASIMVFFSQEFIRLFKRVMSVPGATLVLPLALVSWVVYAFDYWLLWGVFYYRECLQYIYRFLIRMLPFPQYAPSVALVLLMTLISVLPIYLLNWYSRKQTYHPYKYPYVTSSIIWTVTAILIIILGTLPSNGPN